MAVKMVYDDQSQIPEALKDHYKDGGDGKLYLQTDGGDVGALTRAKEHEKNLRVAAENARDEAVKQVEAITGERDKALTELDAANKAKGADVQALEASWQEKLAATQAEGAGTIHALTAEVERLLVTNTAVAMAGEISTVPELFQDVISKRLKVEKGADGQYFTRVLDAAGQPSAATLDELKSELVDNKKYASIIIASKGTGGSAGGTGSSGSASEKKWLDYSDEELIAMRNSDPEKYARLRDAHKGAAAGA